MLALAAPEMMLIFGLTWQIFADNLSSNTGENAMTHCADHHRMVEALREIKKFIETEPREGEDDYIMMWVKHGLDE